MCMFYDKHSKASVYSITYTDVVNPPKVSLTDKRYFNNLAHLNSYVCSKTKSISLIRDDLLSKLFHCYKLFELCLIYQFNV